MTTREVFEKLWALPISTESVGLIPAAADDAAYFCTPENAEPLARLGCDGIHFVLLPGDERVYCVDPAMGEIGTYVLPVAESGEEFLSYLLFCGDANPLTQFYWLTEPRFRALIEEEKTASWPGCEAYFEKKRAALAAIAETFGVSPCDPFAPVRAIQAALDPSALRFSDEYYDVLGLERDAGR